MNVLLVDDEERFAASVVRGLKAEGFTVYVAHDGRAGLELAGSNEYDVIMLDIMLPGINGYTVCSKLRAAGNWAPILILTALEDELDEAEALDFGVRTVASSARPSPRARSTAGRGSDDRRPIESEGALSRRRREWR